MGKAGTIALDGTKLKGNAALDQNKTLKAITKELAEAAQIKDLAENAEFGKNRGRKPKPPATEADPSAKANVTDPDSRILKSLHGFVQGFNGQTVVSMDQIILAADVV